MLASMFNLLLIFSISDHFAGVGTSSTFVLLVLILVWDIRLLVLSFRILRASFIETSRS